MCVGRNGFLGVMMVKMMLVVVVCCVVGGVIVQSLLVVVEFNVLVLIVFVNIGIFVVFDQEVSLKDVCVGQQFGVIVLCDIVIVVGVIILCGMYGVGEVMYCIGKGVYGKLGKMEIQLCLFDIGGWLVLMMGKYCEEGVGKIGVIVVMIVIGGLFVGVFVNGQNVVFEQGCELQGFMLEVIVVVLIVCFVLLMQMVSVVLLYVVVQVCDWVLVFWLMLVVVVVVWLNNVNYIEDIVGVFLVDIFQC